MTDKFVLSQIFGDNKTDHNDTTKLCKNNKIPWVDKYRPKKINEIIHQDNVVKLLKKTLETGNLPHLSFFGPPGTGKTSTILALSYELFGPRKFHERVIELNASDERGINIVRNEIITFAKGVIGSVDPKYPCPPFKIIILDEADAMTAEAQSALRKVMEETSRITRFCIICNYVDKIIEPINSRCMRFRFKPIGYPQMRRKLSDIAKQEKLNINDDILDDIVKLADGDMRKGIMTLQNTKYLIKMNNHITHNDIYELMGYVPHNIVSSILNQCKKSTCDDMSDIMEMSAQFHSNGYPVYNFVDQMGKCVLFDSELNDKSKSFIFIKISDIMIKLNEGGNEHLQLIRLLAYIKLVSQKSENIKEYDLI